MKLCISHSYYCAINDWICIGIIISPANDVEGTQCTHQTWTLKFEKVV